MSTLFLLSPAYCGGERARILVRDEAAFPLARRLRSPDGAPIGEVFSFLSGLYFRGKVAYTEAFGDPPAGLPSGLVITPGTGLRPVDTPIGVGELKAFAEVKVDRDETRYREPLERDALALAGLCGAECRLVLLGSIASDKYVELLTKVFGSQLAFPIDFVGRGDMSRGGLLLRCARAGQELSYAPVLGATRHGPRPPRLPPLKADAAR